jgi:hypothetical protein
MRLIRNTRTDGLCKYAIIRLDKIDLNTFDVRNPRDLAEAIASDFSVVEFGEPNSENEFFVIKLKDKNARKALNAYVDCARAGPDGDSEYANDVQELANRAGFNHPNCKVPD